MALYVVDYKAVGGAILVPILSACYQLTVGLATVNPGSTRGARMGAHMAECRLLNKTVLIVSTLKATKEHS